MFIRLDIAESTKSKLTGLKIEHDSLLTHFFKIIEGKQEEQLVKMNDSLEEIVEDTTPDELLQLKNNYLVLKPKQSDDKDSEMEEEKTQISDSLVTFQSDSLVKLDEGDKWLRIIHFNDVYNIEEKDEEPVSGYARFYTALQQARQGKA